MLKKKINTVYLGLGSNVGDKLSNLQSAVDLINQVPDCLVEILSSVYETKPFGNSEQENFLNTVIKISTGLDQFSLFAELKEIEKKLGRKFRSKWGPREIDIDILFFNDLVFSSEIITLPHKGIISRDFVMIPLLEIAPELVHPEHNKKLSEFIVNLESRYILRKTSYKLKSQVIIYDE